MSTKLVEDWLAQQCAAIPGVTSGIVALPVENSRDRVVVHWPRKDKPVEALIKAVKAVLQHRRPVIQAGGARKGSVIATPAVIAAPLALFETSLGAASLTIRNANGPAITEALAHLRKGISELQKSLEDEASSRHSQHSLQTITHLLATSLSTRGYEQSALAVCNELATEMKCDRVSIGIRHGKLTKLVAMSNSVEIKHRQQFVRSLVMVLDEAIDQKATVTQLPGVDNPDRVTLAHRIFMRDTGDQRGLCTVPLHHDEHIIGAILFERLENRGFDKRAIEFVETASSFIAPVLHMKARVEQSLSEKIWHAISNVWQDIRNGRSRVLQIVIGSVTALSVALALPIYTYRVSAPAKLEGSVQRSITAPIDGFIKRALAVPGQIVQENEVIAILDDDELKIEKKGLDAEYVKLQNEYRANLAKRDLTALTSVRSDIEELESRRSLIDQKLARTQLTAPFAGEIIEGDLTQSLGAPVRRGDVLMTLAPVNDYRIVLYADEKDIAQLSPGQTGKLALSALPSLRHDIRITRITPMAGVREQENVFEVEAKLLSNPEAMLRPGMEGVAKIEIDNRSLFWILLHDAWGWVKLQSWKITGLG